MDYERKVEAACNESFRDEERDVETMKDINKLLIENILPSHVAAKFLNPYRPLDVSWHFAFTYFFPGISPALMRDLPILLDIF